MDATVSAPLLSRVKSWQLIGLGISGWCTLYSAAILTANASNVMIGNAQGGCFAVTMTLAGIEARRYKKTPSAPVDALEWAGGVSTEHLNQTLAQVMQKRDFRIETCQPVETEMGFGVRAINAGRTLVFETGRWKEAVIDLLHVQATEANRRKVRADLAIIVGAGKPAEDAQTFVQTHSIQLLVGKELKDMFDSEKALEAEKAANTEKAPDTGKPADEKV